MPLGWLSGSQSVSRRFFHPLRLGYARRAAF
jgi:hypothetical protein